MSNFFILISLIVYLVLFVGSGISYSKKEFKDSDAAGNGMAKGLTLFYGLGAFFLLGVVLTVVDLFVISESTYLWLKILLVLPIGLPLGIFLFIALELGHSRTVSIEKQCHRLLIEIKSSKELKNGRLSFRSSGGGSGSNVFLSKREDGFSFYQSSFAIYHEMGRTFSLYSDDFKSTKYELDIPFKPKKIPFTNWERMAGEELPKDVEVFFRYRVNK